MAKYRAIYRNEKGATFSAPVEKHGDAWTMQTSDGPVPTTYNFQDDAAGPLTFVEYREEPDTRLHLPERIGTESSFQQLQRAYTESEIAEQRKHRQAVRIELQNQTAQAADPNVRDIANQYAALRKPRGAGTSVALDIPQLTDLEVRSRLRRF